MDCVCFKCSVMGSVSLLGSESVGLDSVFVGCGGF